MKKYLLIIYILLFSINTFTQENNDDKKFNRFGMEVLGPDLGFGFHWSPFPLSFFVANAQNEIISFGLDLNISFLGNNNLIPDVKKMISHSDPNDSFDNSFDFFEFKNFEISGAIGIGIHIGYGKMYPTKTNPNLHVGYLLDFSVGYAMNSIIKLPFYVGFSPNFILEIDQFLFKAGIYADTSATITGTIGIGFLLKS